MNGERIVVSFEMAKRGPFGWCSDDRGPYVFLDRNATHEVVVTEPGDYVVEITNPGQPGHYRFGRVVGDQVEAARILFRRQLDRVMMGLLHESIQKMKRDAIIKTLQEAVTKQLRSTGIKENTTLVVDGYTCEVRVTLNSGRKIRTGKSMFICQGSVGVC